MNGNIEKAAWTLFLAIVLHGCITVQPLSRTTLIKQGMDEIAAAIRSQP